MKDDLVDFFLVDKLSDEVYNIGPNVSLRFNVSLSKITSGKRYHFHKEYEYPVNGINEKTLSTIKRSFDYYLSIENNQKENGNKLFIRIGIDEFFIVKKNLETVISWFTSDEYSKLFVSSCGKLIMTSPIPNCKFYLPQNKYLEFFPTIIDRGIANSDKEPGVRMYLSDPNYFIDVRINKIMGLYYSISTFNMYQAAQILINYLGRPELGTNRYVMPTGGRTFFSSDNEKNVNTVEGRFVKSDFINDDFSDFEK